MTIEALKKAFETALDNGLVVDDPLPVSEDDIQLLVEFIGSDLPESYREYLRLYGTVSIDSVEIYGLLPGKNQIKSIPNTFWFTADLQQKENLPEGFIVIETLGDGAYACLELSKLKNREAPVVLWEANTSAKSIKGLEKLSPSFGEYVYQRVLDILR